MPHKLPEMSAQESRLIQENENLRARLEALIEYIHALERQREVKFPNVFYGNSTGIFK
jgi:hypothetical protein